MKIPEACRDSSSSKMKPYRVQSVPGISNTLQDNTMCPCQRGEISRLIHSFHSDFVEARTNRDQCACK
jgi:hypothetical protein